MNERSVGRVLLLAVVCVILATRGAADWEVGEPYKWFQKPDLGTMGVDVSATSPFVLADDFLCDEPGALTEIHVWGSWEGDNYPYGSKPDEVSFILTIHSDIPAAASTTGYSMPGDTLWVRSIGPGDFTARVYAGGIEEGWMNPPDDYYFPADWTCWQYNFTVPVGEAFFQEGTPDDPVVYWLSVQAFPEDGNTTFGWKTSTEHWNDAAVWGSGNAPHPGPWEMLKYPSGHELVGQPIDLAFTVVGTEVWDFGDAPDPTFPTLLANDGARHKMAPGVYMGYYIDADSDGQPDADASGDDSDGSDDEDGVGFPMWFRSGLESQLYIIASTDGYIDAWIDFNDDGSWAEPGDRIYNSEPVHPGGHDLPRFTVPETATPSQQAIIRVRFSTAGGLDYWGPAPDGEVEDLWVVIEEHEYDFGDAPDPPYPTLLSSSGARHRISWGCNLGPQRDTEPDGQPSLDAEGDDINGTWDDEGGVDFVTPLIPGDSARIVVYVSWPAFLDAWIDWNGDGSWDQTEDKFVDSLQLDYLHNTIDFVVPANATGGIETYARFRASHVGGLDYWGEALSGEMEDYLVTIEGDSAGVREGRPELLGLHRNTPNPFNAATVIRYDIPTGMSDVALRIYDIKGCPVRTLVEGQQTQGSKSVTWDGRNEDGMRVPPGVYFYRLTAEGSSQTRKMVLIE